MTSLHSSISSSEAARYVRVLAIVLAALIAVLLTITTTGYSLGLVDAANQQIYDYQRDKIENLERIEVAFVGDSSLGNAIDAALFGKSSGLASANLALNGSYGAGGAYNIARAVVAHDRPRLIVVMCSPLWRADAFRLFGYTAGSANHCCVPSCFSASSGAAHARRNRPGRITVGRADRKFIPSQRTHPMHTSLATAPKISARK
jgi:hypothetical protein